MEVSMAVNFEAERQRNQEAYERLKPELQKYQGQFVVIAQGRLVAIAPNLPEALQKAQEAAPRVGHRLVFKVGEAYPAEITVGVRSP